MKQKNILTLLLVAACVAFGFTRFDEDPLKRIAQQLEKWLSTNEFEKVYLHTDKPYYAAGDTIWFKAYVTVGSTHQLSATSGIVNVELINDRNKIEQRLRLPVTNGFSWGDIALSDTIHEGNYRVRAYTNYMRNAGEDYFFDRTFSVVNALSNKVFTNAQYKYTVKPDAQGITATINYTDLNGNPYTAKEVSYEVEYMDKRVARGKGVTDDKGNLIISFDKKPPYQQSVGRITTQIKVENKETITKTILLKAVADNIDLQFFPEGGNLVYGLSSKVAFKATGSDGLGKDFKGVVKDDQGKTITDIKSEHLGMGVFRFIPQAGRTYKAQVTYADGSEKMVDLPKPMASGYVIDIDNSSPTLIAAKILSNAKEAADAKITLVAQAGGKLYYAAKGNAGDSSFVTRVPKTRFPTGIVQFTLFSVTGQPLCERLIYVQNSYDLKLDVSAGKSSFKPREKVKLTISSKNEEDKPVTGVFSVAVTDENKVLVDEDAESTIQSNILLTSDIKGYVEKPNYYFKDPSATTRAHLDILLLTQGYRRFEWKQVLADAIPPVLFQPEKSIDIAGKAIYKGKPLANGKITVISTSGSLFVIDTVTDAQGRFSFNNLLFTGEGKFAVQARTEKDKKDVTIQLDSVTQQMVTINKNAPDMQINADAAMIDFMRNSKKSFDEQVRYGMAIRSIMLGEVVIKEKKEKTANSSNLNGSGHADQVLTSKDLSFGCFDLMQCLQGRLAGVMWRNGVPYSMRANGAPMLLVVDGVSLEPDFYSSININDVESIEVMRSTLYTTVYGPRGANGVILVNTKRGSGTFDPATVYSPGVVSYKMPGYSLSKQFYSPMYDDPKTNAKMADLRSTIYWKPDVVTDSLGNASFEYFNADNPATYRVVVEGIDGDGIIGRKVYRYKVE